MQIFRQIGLKMWKIGAIKNPIVVYRLGPKKFIVQHWNFACPIFQADKALTED